MVQLIIKHQTSDVIHIDSYQSILSLKYIIQKKTKIPVEQQILHYNGHLLHNNILLVDYDIHHDSIIHLTAKIKGGFDIMTILLWLLYVGLIFLYMAFLLTGLLPLFAHTYSYSINYIFQLIGNLFNLQDSTIWYLFTTIIYYILNFLIVYFTIYITTAYVLFPLIYKRRGTICLGLEDGSFYGFWVSLFFILIYALMNIPNQIVVSANQVANLTVYSRVAIRPIIGVLQDFVNLGKYIPFYSIPIIGTPFLSGYHTGVDIASNILYDGVNVAAQYNCDNEKAMFTMGMLFKDWRKYPYLTDFVKTKKLEGVFDVLPIAMIPELKERYKCYVENLSYLEKFNPFDSTAAKYYMSEGAFNGFCFAMNIITAFSNVLKSIGSSEDVALTIKDGSVAGLFSVFVFFICLIMAIWYGPE